MKNNILEFEEFLDFRNQEILEGEGFGSDDFFFKKNGDIYNYFFTIETENEEEVGYRLLFGKYSNNNIIEGAKNSYCVLNINRISTELIEDLALDKENIPNLYKKQFKVDDDHLVRLLDFTSKCIISYLEYNPKVNFIYDELQNNIILDGKGEYIQYSKSVIISNIGTSWSAQKGANKNTILFSR